MITRKQLRRIIAEEAQLLKEDMPQSYPAFEDLGLILQNTLIELAERIVSEWKPGGMSLDQIKVAMESEAIPDGIVVNGMLELEELLEVKDSRPYSAALGIMRILAATHRGVGERWSFPG